MAKPKLDKRGDNGRRMVCLQSYCRLVNKLHNNELLLRGVVSVIKMSTFFVACSPLEKKSLFRVVASRFEEKGLHFQALRVGQINLFFFMSLFKRLAKQRVGN